MTNPNGRFGIHGGQYIPETLMNAVIELEEAYNHYKNDPEFNRELEELFNEYAGRPSRLYYAEKMTEDLGGAKIYLKREACTAESISSGRNGEGTCSDRGRYAFYCGDSFCGRKSDTGHGLRCGQIGKYVSPH